MNLLIDDLREIGGMDIVARTWAQGKIDLVENYGEITALYLDHDLGEDIDHRNGYDILEWGLYYGYIPPIVVLVTANPVGFDKMKLALISEGYRDCGGATFQKIIVD